jgi:hypothetical protein
MRRAAEKKGYISFERETIVTISWEGVMYNLNRRKSRREYQEETAWMYPILNDDEWTITSIVPFIASHSPGPPAAEVLVANVRAARQQPPSHPIAVRPAHQVH